jgi:hypothetical protein
MAFKLANLAGVFYDWLGRSGGQAVVTSPQEWGAVHVPAVNTALAATKAAPTIATNKHVVNDIQLGITANATGIAVDGCVFQLVQDAAGTPVVLRSWRLSMPAGAAAAGTHLNLSGLNIEVLAGKSVTLSTTASPGAQAYVYGNIGGHTLPN